MDRENAARKDVSIWLWHLWLTEDNKQQLQGIGVVETPDFLLFQLLSLFMDRQICSDMDESWWQSGLLPQSEGNNDCDITVWCFQHCYLVYGRPPFSLGGAWPLHCSLAFPWGGKPGMEVESKPVNFLAPLLFQKACNQSQERVLKLMARITIWDYLCPNISH